MTGKRKIFIGLLCLIALAWTAFILLRSAKTGAESSAESGRLTAFLRALLGGIPISERLVRKLAHFGEYLILSFPVTSASMLAGGLRTAPFAWAYAVLVALCDEFAVQAMTAGRGPRFSDVLIDSAGALVGVGAVVLAFFVLRRIRAKKA